MRVPVIQSCACKPKQCVVTDPTTGLSTNYNSGETVIDACERQVYMLSLVFLLTILDSTVQVLVRQAHRLLPSTQGFQPR
jgi:hypothetical protein